MDTNFSTVNLLSRAVACCAGSFGVLPREEGGIQAPGLRRTVVVVVVLVVVVALVVVVVVGGGGSRSLSVASAHCRDLEGRVAVSEVGEVEVEEVDGLVNLVDGVGVGVAAAAAVGGL